MRVYIARKGGFMRILILDNNESFAYSLEKALNEIEPNVALAPNGFNLDHIDDWLTYIERLKPDCVIYRGGIRSVHKGQKEKELTELYNTLYTAKLLEVCKNNDLGFMFISSNQVFDGKSNHNYRETDLAHPINNYGKSMLKAENVVKTYEKGYIVRPGWIFGYPSDEVNKYINKAVNNHPINVNCNILANAIYLNDFAYRILYLILNNKYGIYHIYNNNAVTKAKMCDYVLKEMNLKTVVNDVDSSETLEYQYNPEFLVMDTNHDVIVNRDWQAAMDEYIYKLKVNNMFYQ